MSLGGQSRVTTEWVERLDRAISLIRVWGGLSLQVVGTGLLALAGIGPSYDWDPKIVGACFLVGLILTAIAIALGVRRRTKLADLEKVNFELTSKADVLSEQVKHRTRNLIHVVEVLLRDLAVDLNIYSGDTRLSVYKHSGDRFCLVGRVSPNEAYAAAGRPSYHANQGFIGKVWIAADDKTSITLPAGREDWIETQVASYGFTRAEAEALTMQTVKMTAIKLRRDHHGAAFGVLCIECDSKRGPLNAGIIEEVKASRHLQTLTSVLDISLTGLTHDEVLSVRSDLSTTRG